MKEENIEEIYVVTQGDYSDYQILGAFTDKELAEEFANKFNAEVEVYSNNLGELDSKGKDYYCVYMDKEGNTSKVEKLKYFSKCGDNSFIETRNSRLYSHITESQREYELYCTCWAKDEEHAVKIVNERRAQHIANNTWGRN